MCKCLKRMYKKARRNIQRKKLREKGREGGRKRGRMGGREGKKDRKKEGFRPLSRKRDIEQTVLLNITLQTNWLALAVSIRRPIFQIRKDGTSHQHKGIL